MFDIYHSDRNDTWRYTLGKAGRRPLLTVGLNPSTATQEKADPTVARVQKVAELHGFDGFVMLNLYPVRATDYRTLPPRVNAEAFERNLQVIEEVVGQHERPTTWAAWGSPVMHHEYFLKARDSLYVRLGTYQPAWRRLGDLTAGGHPRHASRIDYSWKFEIFDLSR